MKTQTDSQLISLYLDGNNKAFEVLINRHKDRIFTSILILVKDPHLAEDIFQDTFIKIIDTLRVNGYKEEDKFSAWAQRIAHNLCIDHFRMVKRRPSITTSDDRDIFELIDTLEPGADSHIIREQTQETIQALIELLPSEQREVIALRHFAGLPFKQIAALLDCSINTALGRMRYGLLNMRRIIKQKQIAV